MSNEYDPSNPAMDAVNVGPDDLASPDIAKLPGDRLATMHGLADELTCAICLNIIWDAESVRGCGHVFCYDCLDIWRDRNGAEFTCPTCRHVSTTTETCLTIDNIIHQLKVR